MDYATLEYVSCLCKERIAWGEKVRNKNESWSGIKEYRDYVDGVIENIDSIIGGILKEID